LYELPLGCTVASGSSNIPTNVGLGHSSLKTTARYLHLTSCGQEDAALKINGVMQIG